MALKLPRLQPGVRLINPDGTPTATFILWWKRVADQTEKSIGDIEAALTAAGIATTAAAAANAAAAAADAAADAAQATATAITNENAISASYVDGYTPPLISADSAGGVTIANHNRVYGNGVAVAVTGGSVATALAPLSIARIYYDQPSRAGGVVSYQFTTDPAVAAQTGSRHSVGAVEIPSAGTQDGNAVFPPGYALP